MQKIAFFIALFAMLGCASPTSLPAAGSPAERAGERRLIDYIGSYLITRVSQKTGLRVERVNDDGENGVRFIGTKDDRDGMLVMTVRKFSLHSPDVLSMPLEANLSLELTVLNGQKQAIYFKTATGRRDVRFEAFIDQQNTKDFVAALVKDALSQYAEDPEFKRMIAKLKYGSVGNLIGIF